MKTQKYNELLISSILLSSLLIASFPSLGATDILELSSATNYGKGLRLVAKQLTLSKNSMLADSSKVQFPEKKWRRKIPGSLGLKKKELDRLARTIGGAGVVIKDGYIVKTWGSQTTKYLWDSASKPIFSTLLFFAINEGRVASVDEKIKKWGWKLKGKDRQISFRNLANMTSGYTRIEASGQRWSYNDFGFGLYAKTILGKVYKTRNNKNAGIRVALHKRRLGKLQFENRQIFAKKKGHLRAYLTVQDFARIGWFWLNKGNWKGEQLLPSWFFSNYMRAGVSSSLKQSEGGKYGAGDYLGVGTYGGKGSQTPLGPGVYGFNWWTNERRRMWPNAPSDAVQANGHWNKQAVTVIPSLGIVAVWYRNHGGDDPRTFKKPMNGYLKILVGSVIALKNSNHTILDG